MAIVTVYTQPVVLVLCVRWFLKKPLKLARPLVLLYTLTAVPHTLYLLATCTSTKGVSGNGTHPRLGMGKAQISFWMDHEGAFFGVTDGHILGWL